MAATQYPSFDEAYEHCKNASNAMRNGRGYAPFKAVMELLRSDAELRSKLWLMLLAMRKNSHDKVYGEILHLPSRVGFVLRRLGEDIAPDDTIPPNSPSDWEVCRVVLDVCEDLFEAEATKYQGGQPSFKAFEHAILNPI